MSFLPLNFLETNHPESIQFPYNSHLFPLGTNVFLKFLMCTSNFILKKNVIYDQSISTYFVYNFKI